MTSLRVKVTTALLCTSFAAIALLGLTARGLIKNRFDDLVIDRAFAGFSRDIAERYASYGSWEAAREAEFAVPAHFLVIDVDGVVLLPLDRYETGQVVSEEMRTDGRPLEIGGQVIAYGVPLDRPQLTTMEEQYLSSIEDAWLLALLVAVATMVPLSLFFGGRLTPSVGSVTEAISAMGQGHLRQVVDVGSNDEMGALSAAFNRMSNDLADLYEELQRSNATISAQAARLQRLSIRDELTGLFNRREFDEQASRMYAQATRYEHPLAFVMGDIDHFKQINDRFSHAVGDEVLRAVARVFRSNTREIDVVARYGGEEFVIAFPETPVTEAVGLTERLRVAIKEHRWTGIHPGLSVTISMGLNADIGLGSFEEMLAAADKELYQAKESGRDRVCY